MRSCCRRSTDPSSALSVADVRSRGWFRCSWALVVAGLGLFAPLLSRAAPDPTLGPVFTQLAQPVTLPAQMVNGVLLVDATINGLGPFHLLVDTGCSAPIISPEVAAAIDARSLDEPDNVAAVNSLGMSGSLPFVLLESVDLGAAHFEGVSAAVTPLDLQSKITGQRIDGILGYSLFSELFLTLDFPRRRITLSPEFPQDLPRVRSELALKEIDAAPFVTIDVQGHTFDVMLDSGANGGLELDTSVATSLEWKISPRATGLVAAVGGVGRSQTGRLSGTATLGRVTQIEPIVGLTTGLGRIGTEFLQSLCVVFNRSENKVWLCADSTAPIPSAPHRTVGLSILADAGGWRVVATMPDSPAEKAAIAPGDLIATIENSPAQRWSREDIQRWLNHHDALALGVNNSSGSRQLQLPVWSPVP